MLTLIDRENTVTLVTALGHFCGRGRCWRLPRRWPCGGVGLREPDIWGWSWR